jgi:hypothetical protein
MEYSVELEKLPPSVTFPERLRERVRFDADKRRLIFQGFMTKCTYDELSALTDDLAYHRALEELFVLTSAEMSGGTPRRSVSAAALVAAVGTLALLGGMVWAALRTTPPSSTADPRPDVRVSAVTR